MRSTFAIGVVLLILGLASLFVSIPQRERHGIEVGGASVGVETQTSRKVAPVVSAALIAGGAVVMLMSRRRTA
jgi:hypothetical protein